MRHKLLYLVLSILILAAATTALTINNQGVYQTGNKTYVRTADVVVCRGTSLLDDAIKQISCDVVCASTDTGCSTLINSNVRNDSSMFFGPGYFPIDLPLIVASNFTMSGSGIGVTVLQKQAGQTGGNADTIRTIITSNYYNNVKISDLTIDGTLDNSSVGVGIQLKGIDNLQLINIQVINTSDFGIVLGTNAGALPYVINTNLNNIIINNVRNDGDAIGGGGLSYCNFNNIYITRSTGIGTGSFIDITNRDGCTFNNMRLIGTNTTSANWGFSGDFNITNEVASNVIIKNTNYGVYIGKFSNNLLYSNFIIDGTTTHGVFLDGLGGTIGNVTLDKFNIKNWALNAIGAGVHIKHAQSISLLNSYLTTAGSDYGVRFESGLMNNSQFINNYIAVPTYTNRYVLSVLPSDLYIDNFQFTNDLISMNCTSNYGVLSERTIHNSTAQCTCISGAWKCLTYS